MDKLHQSEGDINISPRRDQWQNDHLDAESRALLAEDARYFLQAVPFDAVPEHHGRLRGDLRSRTRRAGATWTSTATTSTRSASANPDVIAAIKRQLDELPFCTRRYTNRVAVDAGQEAGGDRPRAA